MEQALRHVRTTDPAAAGGPTGQSYVHLRTWLDEDDLSTERFVGMLNRIIAGDVPTDIVPILTASRGIALVKDEKMNLRPICIGSVILRFVAGLALRLSRREVDDFFLHNAKAKQFGVGVPSGCNLQALAVEEHLRRHPGAIAIQLDCASAFNCIGFCINASVPAPLRIKIWSRSFALSVGLENELLSDTRRLHCERAPEGDCRG